MTTAYERVPTIDLPLHFTLCWPNNTILPVADPVAGIARVDGCKEFPLIFSEKMKTNENCES